jgi:hypothetical protein
MGKWNGLPGILTRSSGEKYVDGDDWPNARNKMGMYNIQLFSCKYIDDHFGRRD